MLGVIALLTGERDLEQYIGDMAERGQTAERQALIRTGLTARLCNTKGYSSTYLAMGLAGVRAGTQMISSPRQNANAKKRANAKAKQSAMACYVPRAPARSAFLAGQSTQSMKVDPKKKASPRAFVFF